MRLYLLIFLLLSTSLVVGQAKPQKTFNHEKFASKVYGNFSAGMDPTVWLPDDKALEYISAKSGKSMDELKQERDKNRIYIDQDRKILSTKNASGLMVTKAELKTKPHPTLVMADIIIVLAGGKRIELGNCIQTDITWVLGDYLGLEGERPVREKISSQQDKIDEIVAMNSKVYEAINGKEWEVFEVVIFNDNIPTGKMARGGKLTSNPLYWFAVDIKNDGTLKGSMFKGQTQVGEMGNRYVLNKENSTVSFYNGDKLTYTFTIRSVDEKKMVLKTNMETDEYYFVAYVNEKNKPMAVDTTQVSEPAIMREKYTAYYSSSTTDPSDAYVKRDLFGKPVRGYYIDKNGNKIDAVIKYQAPESMQSGTSALLLYNIAHNETGFTEDETNNFKGMISKSEIRAFYVAGYLYIPVQRTSAVEWNILLTEGAIRESVWIGTIKKDGVVTGYVVNQMIHKHVGSTFDLKTLMIGFKGQMSSLVSDFEALATKIKNKEDGYKYLQYQNITKEYNTWYDTHHAGKLTYFYKY